MGAVHDVQQEVGVQGFLQGGMEGGHEVVREAPEESDGVGEQDDTPIGEFPLARARVEGGEEHVRNELLRARQAIQQGRLAGVGVPDEADREEVRARAHLAHPALLDLLQLGLQIADPLSQQAPVRLELRLPRSAGTDRPIGPFEVRPHPAQTGKEVLVLGQLDLQAGLASARAPHKDVEDQLRAVDDTHPEDLLEVAALGWREVVVDDHGVGMSGLHGGGHLLRLSLPHQSRRVRPRAALDDSGTHDLPISGAHQSTNLVQGTVVFGTLVAQQDAADEDPLARRERRAGLATHLLAGPEEGSSSPLGATRSLAAEGAAASRVISTRPSSPSAQDGTSSVW